MRTKTLPLITGVTVLLFTGCERSGPKHQTAEETDDITPMGLYHSEKGMGGWGGTIEIYGDHFIMKDRMLRDGEMAGECKVKGNTITFYQDGATLFTANLDGASIRIPGKATYSK